MVWTPEEYSNSILDPLIVLWSAPLLYASSLLIFSISVFLCFITSAWFCLLDECVDHRVTVSRSHGHSNKSIRFGNFTGWCPVFGACSVIWVLSRSEKRRFFNLVSGISSDFLGGLGLANYALNCYSSFCACSCRVLEQWYLLFTACPCLWFREIFCSVFFPNLSAFLLSPYALRDGARLLVMLLELFY